MSASLDEKATPSWFTNEWPRSFFTPSPRAGKDDVPAFEGRGRIGGHQNEPIHFLPDPKDLSFPSESNGVKRYCCNVRPKDIENGVGDAGTRKALWIDDRKSDDQTGCGSSRRSNGWMTATGALRYLRQSV